MKKTKEKLTFAIDNLMKEGEELKDLDEKNSKNAEAGWFEKFKGNRKLGGKFTEFRAKFDALNE
jgi:hypothetical protein